MPYFKVSTAVTTEPITLAELKQHIRVYDDGYNDTQSETITTRAAGAGAVTGAGVDILGCQATVWINIGAVAAGGSVSVKVQHSDDNNTYTDFNTASTYAVTGSTSIIYTGGKRYIRAYAVVAVNTVTFGVNVQILAGDPVNDTELSSIITRAREEAEEITRLAFAPQTLEIGLDEFPDKDYINLPRPPLSSVTSVDTYDSAGTKTTLTVTTQYLVDTDSVPGRIVLPYSGTWPTDADYPINPIRIKYVCGYTALPQRLKSILLYHCGLLYKYRDTAIPVEERKSLERMYNFYRVSWFGGEA